jgi:alpha-1,2-rhamnosyltransferase
MKNKLYIECTHTYDTEILTGIQRVVRNIVREAQLIGQSSDDLVVIPVIIVDDRFVAIEQLPNHVYEQSIKAEQQSVMGRLVSYVRSAVQYLSHSRMFISVLKVLRNNSPRLFNLLKKVYIKFKLLFIGKNTSSKLSSVEFEKGDILLMLDSSWHMPIWKAIDKAKSQSVFIVFTAYDLIPLSHPQFCDEYLVKVFSDFYAKAIQQANGFIAISESVKKDVERYIQQVEPTLIKQKQFNYFHLGADFHQQLKNIKIRDELINLYQLDAQHYLIVSTIEPRKNHVYLLDAFEQIWRESELSVTLTIVGRVGWKVDALMARINQHPELGRRLFVFHDLTDAELSYCYEHATALIFPSIVEGFGLPIIEAFQHGLPVIASDIPVHREIAGNLAYYISLDDPLCLVNLIGQIQRQGIAPEHLPGNDYHWLTWQEATHLLLRKLVSMAQASKVKL